LWKGEHAAERRTADFERHIQDLRHKYLIHCVDVPILNRHQWSAAHLLVLVCTHLGWYQGAQTTARGLRQHAERRTADFEVRSSVPRWL
jgi:hypothetical protein